MRGHIICGKIPGLHVKIEEWDKRICLQFYAYMCYTGFSRGYSGDNTNPCALIYISIETVLNDYAISSCMKSVLFSKYFFLDFF